MSDQDSDNVYINSSVVKQIIDDLSEKTRVNPRKCQCGSIKFTADREKSICLICGQVYDPSREPEKFPPESCP